MNDFNLIVSSSRFREEQALDEILDLLMSFGDPDAEVEMTNVRGIILARTVLNPLKVVESLKKLVAGEPWGIRHVFRVIPVQRVVPAELQEIQSAAEDMASHIPPDDSFRVIVEKRHSPLHSVDIIECVAEVVKCRVDLTKPDWVVLIEIVGKHAGVSVIRRGQIFSAVVEKRGG